MVSAHPPLLTLPHRPPRGPCLSSQPGKWVCVQTPTQASTQQQLRGFQHFLWLFTALGYGSDFLLRAMIQMSLQEIEWPLGIDTLSRCLLGTGLVCPILAMRLASLSEWEMH